MPAPIILAYNGNPLFRAGKAQVVGDGVDTSECICCPCCPEGSEFEDAVQFAGARTIITGVPYAYSSIREGYTTNWYYDETLGRCFHIDTIHKLHISVTLPEKNGAYVGPAIGDCPQNDANPCRFFTTGGTQTCYFDVPTITPFAITGSAYVRVYSISEIDGVIYDEEWTRPVTGLAALCVSDSVPTGWRMRMQVSDGIEHGWYHYGSDGPNIDTAPSFGFSGYPFFSLPLDMGITNWKRSPWPAAGLFAYEYDCEQKKTSTIATRHLASYGDETLYSNNAPCEEQNSSRSVWNHDGYFIESYSETYT